MEFYHKPVLLEEVMEGLDIKDNGIYFDGTVGGGGHSKEILGRSQSSKVIATDLDDEAIEAASENLKGFEGRFKIVKSNFKDFENVLDEAGVDRLDGALLDLGVSSHQIDSPSRGFSYMYGDAPLDMRMDTSGEITAAYILNNRSEKELERIFREYGEERFASRIAAEVVRVREEKPFETCEDLTRVVTRCIPAKFQQNGPPQRKVFQALRIAVNGELEGLYDCIIALVRRLKKGGRIAVISFHSLEDRIVKSAYSWLERDCVCPPDIPVCVCDKVREIKILTKKPICADLRELTENGRAKSAKLRVAEKIVD